MTAKKLEKSDNLEFKHSIIKTAEKYFNCDANNFLFNHDSCCFSLYLGVFRVQITVSPKTAYLPKSSRGYVYYGNYTWERNIKDDTFEDSCRKIAEFIKEQAKESEEGLV